MLAWSVKYSPQLARKLGSNVKCPHTHNLQSKLFLFQHIHTQCFLRTFHKYGFDKDLKSHGSGQEVSETKLDTFTRLLIPTEDQKNGAEGGFLVILVGTIYMRVVVVSIVSVAGWPCADLITDLAVVTL